MLSVATERRARSIAAQSDPGATPAPSDATVVSATVFTEPGVVLRARYELVRTLLVIALVVIVGLTYEVVVLATTKTTAVLQKPTRAVDYFDLNRNFAEAAATVEPGARLDHAGRR
jgi:hypothetical protein